MENNNFGRPILMIEDNPMDIDLTKRAFMKRNLVNPIEVATDGEAGLAYIDRWDAGEPTPLVILLDLKLPKVDGLEVLRRFKSHSVYRTIPVVVLTTSSEDIDVKRAYEFGVNSYIVKPVNFDKFMEIAVQIELYWNVINNPAR